jgi:hypothetical protein
MTASAAPGSVRPTGDPSIAELLGEVVADAQHLVRSEIQLAKQEVRDEIGQARRGALELALGGGVAAAGGMLLLVAIVQLLIAYLGLAPWLAYTIVGAVAAGIGLGLLQLARGRIAEVDVIPREAVQSVRKDVEWIRQQTP